MTRSRRTTRGPREILKDLYDPAAAVRWAAVRELGGWAVSRWKESPRVVRDLVRRLAWSLNEESGAAGWGAPEAMAEIIGRIPDLRIEFVSLYPAYLGHEDVFLGNEVLDTGALWALGRLGPGRILDSVDLAGLVRPFLGHRDPAVRGAATWAAGRHGLSSLAPEIRALRGDPAEVTLLIDGGVEVRILGELAEEALSAF